MQPSTARTPSPLPRRAPIPAGKPHPSPQFEPLQFRAHPCPSPGTEISRPVALRSRNSSFCTTGVCPVCSGCTPSTCRSARSWSLGEMRPPNRVVSFGSAVTPQSNDSTDGEDAARNSWDWPWDEDDRNNVTGARRRHTRFGPSPSDSSSSSADCSNASCGALMDRPERSGRGAGRYRPTTVSAPRTQSALVDGCCNNTPRADGPRPWDMTESSHTSKNFASFGFRRNHEGGVSFADTFSSRHLLRHSIKGGGRTSGNDWLKNDDQRRQGKKRFRFLRKFSALRWNSGRG